MNRSDFDVTVVGGGVIGLCCAYYLTKKGHRVQILDQDAEGDESGASYGNSGMIVPSHFIPLAAPGVVGQGMRWMLDSSSPLYIKPRLNANFLRWLYSFIRNANQSNVNRSSSLLRDLNLTSKQLYKALADEESLDFELTEKGIVMIARTDHTWKEEKHVGDYARTMGIEVQDLEGKALQNLEQKVEIHARGGVHYPMDAHLIPGLFVRQLHELLRERGVIIRKGLEVNDFVADSNDIMAVQTSEGEVPVNNLVLASGSWTGNLASQLGLTIPMQAGKGYSFVIERSKLPLDVPAILIEARVAVTPMAGKVRFGGTMEIAGMNKNINMRRVKAIVNSIPQYYPEFDSKWVDFSSVWSGFRPLSPDGVPYIGRSTKFSNLLVATGHAMMGLSLAPVTGKIIADVIDEEETGFNMELLRPDRFS